MAPSYIRKLLRIHHQNHKAPSTEPSSPARHTFSATLMEENIEAANSIITKWDSNSSDLNLKSLADNQDETQKFIQAVEDLQRSMIFFTSPECIESPISRSSSLIRAQGLMQIAMRRLEKEFHKMLSSNRDMLDPEVLSSVSSVSTISDLETDDEIRIAKESIGEVDNIMAGLRTIAQAMISSGYGKECVRIYKLVRKSIVDEGLYNLGFDFKTANQIQKLDWMVLDLKIQNWLSACGAAIRILFTGERILCDYVFEGSDSIKESIFADITKEAAINFLGFAESVAKTKRSPEKLFRILDMYNTVSDLWIDFDSVFSYESTTAVRLQALNSLLKLADAARSTLSEFEAAIQKDTSKVAVPGGAIHPLTRYAMNYIVFLADYEGALCEIYADFPMQMPALPEAFLDSSAILSSPMASPARFESGIGVRIAWLILVVLCKLDGKAELYKEAALSYLFLANNLMYMVTKVRESKLGFILGEDWITKHSAKAKRYVAGYQRLGWSRVAESVPETEGQIGNFNVAFEEAVRVQREWVVADRGMKEEIRMSVAEMIVPAYRAFYDVYRSNVPDDVASALRFAPEDLMGRVMQLFSGNGSGSGSSHGSSKSSWWSGSH